MKCIIGSMFSDCTLYLPDSTTLKTALQVKNLCERANPDGLAPRRIGCLFYRPSPMLTDKIQRYIIKLEAVRW
ncbi:MAG: hypothetical protein HYZ45_02120 [Burkholderiales bacterium]|nr:hypothetical protein [Burkholderiales bacterium]